MKKFWMVILCLALSLGFAPEVLAASEKTLQDVAVQRALETVKQAYSDQIIVGQPIEVNGLKLLPLATVGVGVGPYQKSPDREELTGVGGVLIPIGVIVVSGQNVRIIQVSRGVVEQLVSALAPLALRAMNRQSLVGEEEQQQTTVPQLAPQGNVLSTYWKFVVFAWIIWFVVTLLIERFFPNKIAAICTTFRYKFIQISLLGILGYGLMALLVVIFTVSLIGIPFTFVVLILTGILTLLGTIGLALFIGQESARAFKYEYSEMRFLLIGGVLFGLVGMIPFVGIIVWALISVVGFGAIVQMQWESMGKKFL